MRFIAEYGRLAKNLYERYPVKTLNMPLASALCKYLPIIDPPHNRMFSAREVEECGLITHVILSEKLKGEAPAVCRSLAWGPKARSVSCQKVALCVMDWNSR